MRTTHLQRIAALPTCPARPDECVVDPFARPLAANDDHFDVPLLVGGCEHRIRATQASVAPGRMRALARRVLGLFARAEGG